MPTPSAEQGLQFSFAEMRQEIVNLSAAARDFLTPESCEYVIPNWMQQLRSFSKDPHGSELSWQISNPPIETKPSPGEYEVGGGGKHTVFGRLTAIWEIRTPNAGAKTKKKYAEHRVFHLLGLASTKISILNWDQAGNHVELARWKFEVGDAKSPGCHFHVQILGEKGDRMFPSTMCVPRLPGILVTPMDALEYLLAELFQERWKQCASQRTSSIQAWSGCQRKRLLNMLAWQREKIAGLDGSPWTSLKGQKPASDVLISEPRR